MLPGSWKKIMWVGAAILALFIIGVFYSLFFKPQISGGMGGNNVIILLLLGLFLGALFMFQSGQNKSYRYRKLAHSCRKYEKSI